MNQEEIKKILPHRDNMLLVEEAECMASESVHVPVRSRYSAV